MRKRPIVLASAAAVAGLALLGTVVAQQPVGTFPQPKVAPAGGPLPGTTVRPYGEWSPSSPQPASPAAGLGRTPPGGAAPQPPAFPPPGNRPPAGGAGASPVRPAGGVNIPPPSMDVPAPGPKPLPPPSLSVEPGDSKFSAPVGPGSAPAPYVPVPPAPGAGAPAVPPPVATPVVPPATSTPVIPPPVAVPPAGAPTPPPGAAPKPFPAGGPPAVPPATAGAAVTGTALPTRVSQSVTLEAVCPESVGFNVDCQYELVVRNTGNVAAHGVRVEDEIPAGCRYVSSDPPAEVNGDKLVWAIGALEAGTDKRIAVRVRPVEEGELRSRATVTYGASVEARTKVTRPRLAVTVSGPEVARAGEQPVFKITVTNSGTGPAEKLVLQAGMTEGLAYGTQGNNLEAKLSKLPAGKTETVELPLTALKSGLHACQVTVTAEGSPGATAKASVNVVEPLLAVAQVGPAKCLVRAEPMYEITLSNPGTASTDPVTVQTVVPDGFDFVQASDAGTFSATARVVTWKLGGLPAGGTKAVGVKLRATAAGDAVLSTVATAVGDDKGAVAPAGVGVARAGRALQAKAETPVKAEGVAALRFEVAGLENPVEVGKEAVYEIRVVNQGTGACTNVQIMAALADGTTYTGSNGPTKGTATGQTLVFEPLASLAVKGETVYRVRVRGAAAGDARFRVQLTCDQVRSPVVKEESTRFYTDK